MIKKFKHYKNTDKLIQSNTTGIKSIPENHVEVMKEFYSYIIRKLDDKLEGFQKTMSDSFMQNQFNMSQQEKYDLSISKIYTQIREIKLRFNLKKSTLLKDYKDLEKFIQKINVDSENNTNWFDKMKEKKPDDEKLQSRIDELQELHYKLKELDDTTAKILAEEDTNSIINISNGSENTNAEQEGEEVDDSIQSKGTNESTDENKTQYEGPIRASTPITQQIL